MQKIKDNLGLIFISLITILYLWLACNLVINFDEVKALKLNEKGDFLAGIFSPLAFLWLVYGYLQQGQELKQNNETLRLQSEELANLVQEQSKQNYIHEHNMRLKRFESQPKIVFNNASYAYKINDYDGEYFEGTVFYINIVNFGKIAKDVHIVSNGFERRFHKLESDIVTSMIFSFPNDVEKELHTFNGQLLELEFDISYYDNSGYKFNEKIIVFTDHFVSGAVDLDFELVVKD